MKNISRIITVLVLIGLWFMPAAAAEEVKPSAEQKLKILYDKFSDAREEYREALKAYLRDVAKERKSLLEILPKEQSETARKEMLSRIEWLGDQELELNDKLRVISAGEVVELSNKKDKIVSFLTHQ